MKKCSTYVNGDSTTYKGNAKIKEIASNKF